MLFDLSFDLLSLLTETLLLDPLEATEPPLLLLEDLRLLDADEDETLLLLLFLPLFFLALSLDLF